MYSPTWHISVDHTSCVARPMGETMEHPPDVARPVTVLWLIKGLGPGGAERLLVAAARVRDRERVAPRVGYVLPWKDTLVPELQAAGVPAECLGEGRFGGVRWPFRLRASLRRDPVDIVHAHSPLVAAGARLVVRSLPRRLRPRLVATEHNVWESHARLTRIVNRLSLPLDDRNLAVSHAVRASLPSRLRGRVEVVRYGVDLDEVRSHRGERGLVRSELGLAPDAIVIGTVANLRANKAYPDLLAAARLVVDRAPETIFLSAGQGPLAADLAAERDALGLGSSFRFLGYRDDVTRLLAGFDVFCLASRHEGLPIALLEALGLGIPIVATSVGGVPEVVTDGRDAVLVPPAQPVALAEAILALVGDPGRRATLAAAAEATSAGWSITTGVRRTEAIYQELMAP